MRKLRSRDPERAERLQGIRRPQAHPLFRVIRCPVQEWERRGELPSFLMRPSGSSKGTVRSHGSGAGAPLYLERV